LTEDLKTGELVASWVVAVGDQDQAIHLWRYKGGYSAVDAARHTLLASEVNLSKFCCI